MEEIELGQPQPLPCPVCKVKRGYQVSDLMRTHYTILYNPDGSQEEGMYSDYQPIIHYGKTARCIECHTRLPFKFKRENG